MVTSVYYYYLLVRYRQESLEAVRLGRLLNSRRLQFSLLSFCLCRWGSYRAGGGRIITRDTAAWPKSSVMDLSGGCVCTTRTEVVGVSGQVPCICTSTTQTHTRHTYHIAYRFLLPRTSVSVPTLLPFSWRSFSPHQNSLVQLAAPPNLSLTSPLLPQINPPRAEEAM